MPTDIEALATISFKPYYDASDIWRDDVIHVDGLHKNAFDEVRHLFEILKSGEAIGNVVIEGRPKSHFLGCLRRNVIADEDFFVLIELNSARHFWESLAVSYRDAFFRDGCNRRTQSNPSSALTKLRSAIAASGLGDRRA
jgi:hypothetical protein